MSLATFDAPTTWPSRSRSGETAREMSSRLPSFATRTASPASRLERNAETPCETPAANPLTFFTGVVIAVETARTAVSALSAIDTALSVTVSSLSSWSFTRSTVPPAFTITGSRSRSEPLMNDESRAKVPPIRMNR